MKKRTSTRKPSRPKLAHALLIAKHPTQKPTKTREMPTEIHAEASAYHSQTRAHTDRVGIRAARRVKLPKNQRARPFNTMNKPHENTRSCVFNDTNEVTHKRLGSLISHAHLTVRTSGLITIHVLITRVTSVRISPILHNLIIRATSVHVRIITLELLANSDTSSSIRASLVLANRRDNTCNPPLHRERPPTFQECSRTSTSFSRVHVSISNSSIGLLTLYLLVALPTLSKHSLKLRLHIRGVHLFFDLLLLRNLGRTTPYHAHDITSPSSRTRTRRSRSTRTTLHTSALSRSRGDSTNTPHGVLETGHERHGSSDSGRRQGRQLHSHLFLSVSFQRAHQRTDEAV